MTNCLFSDLIIFQSRLGCAVQGRVKQSIGRTSTCSGSHKRLPNFPSSGFFARNAVIQIHRSAHLPWLMRLTDLSVWDPLAIHVNKGCDVYNLINNDELHRVRCGIQTPNTQRQRMNIRCWLIVSIRSLLYPYVAYCIHTLLIISILHLMYDT